MLQQAIITKHCNQNVKVTESKHEAEHLKTHTCVHVQKSDYGLLGCDSHSVMERHQCFIGTCHIHIQDTLKM